MHHLLTDIAFSIIAAALFGTLAFWLKQPTILGYLLAGACIGPTVGLKLISDPESVQVISELGLILLLFIIGLEINPRKLISSGRQLAVVGIGQFLVCALLGVIVFSMFPSIASNGGLQLLYPALLCALSSTAVVVKMLCDKFELDTRSGRMTLGILIVQDLWAILILALQPHFSDPSVMLFVEAVLKSVALLLGGFLVSRFVLKPIFNYVAKSPEIVVILSIGWCTGLAHIAGLSGLSREMGALIAGLSIGAFPYSIHVTAKTLPLRDFFLTLFFMSLGMKIIEPELGLIAQALILVAFTVVSRFLSVYPLMLLAGAGQRTAFVTSVNLAQLSEFALVIGSLGVLLGHIDSHLVSVLIYAMAISSVLSSYGIKYNHALYRQFAKLLYILGIKRKGVQERGIRGSQSHPIVLLGYHHGGKELVELLAEFSPDLLPKVSVIDFNQEELRELRKQGIHAIFGDLASFDTLAHAHLEQAMVIVLTIPDLILKGTNNEQLVRACRVIAPNAIVIALADSREHAERLRGAGASEALLFYSASFSGLPSTLLELFSESVESTESDRNAANA